MLNILPEGILLIDEKKVVRYANSSMLSLYQTNDKRQVVKKISEMMELEVVELEKESPLPAAKTTFSSYSSFKPSYSLKVQNKVFR